VTPEALIVRIERGLMRRLPAGMVVAGNARLHRWKGEQELRELPRLVTPGTIAVDVGAHFGTYSYALARLVGKTGLVISVEPIAEDADLLESAARQLRLPIQVHRCALSSTSGVATLNVPDLHGRQKTALASLQEGESGSTTSREVETRTLDHLLANVDRPVSFIKIDVEGHERAVLKGGREAIARHKPNLLIEIEGRFNSTPIEKTFDQVIALGYRGEFIDGQGIRHPLEEFDLDTHQNPRHDVLSKAYIGNFMFRPVEPGGTPRP
jgi:FkbM family methyltransferase